jgi:hypothetical protein
VIPAFQRLKQEDGEFEANLQIQGQPELHRKTLTHKTKQKIQNK